MRTILACNNVENLAIADELADVLLSPFVMNGLTQSAALATSLLVVFHTKKHVVIIPPVKRLGVLGERDERIKAVLIILLAIGV